jgi:integrin beta 3
MSDMVTFARDLATDTQAYIARYVTKALGGVSERVDRLEQRMELVTRAPGPPGEMGPAGRDADLTMIAELKAEVAMLKAAIEARPWPDSATVTKALGELVTAEVNRMPVPRDGRDVDVAMLQGFVEAAAIKAIAALPVPKSGRDGLDGKPGTDGMNGRDGIDGKAGADGVNGRDGESLVGPVGPVGPSGRDGASVTLDDVQPLIASAVAQAVAALPPPVAGPAGERGADGDDGVTMMEVRPLVAELVADAVKSIALPKDGVGLMDALINRDGELVVTFTDGRTKTVGRVEGKDVDPTEVIRIVTDVATKTLDSWPRPKDGENGADGLGFDDLEFEWDDHGRPFLKFVKGAITKRVRLPAIIDQKVWRAGTKYFKGDAVTHNRSLFIAQVDQPSGKPEDASGDWRLAVMRGRDAAQPKPAPED